MFYHQDRFVWPTSLDGIDDQFCQIGRIHIFMLGQFGQRHPGRDIDSLGRVVGVRRLYSQNLFLLVGFAEAHDHLSAKLFAPSQRPTNDR